MPGFKVANRYAISLLETSLEKNSLEQAYNDMKMLVKLLDMSYELKHAIESPIIKPGIKILIVDEIFEKRISVDSLKFIRFVINKRREEILYEIAKRFLELRDEHLGIVNVDVKTAFEFTAEQKKQLKEKFKIILNKTVILKYRVDKNIIGGFVARVGDTVYDASILHQLELLKKEFIQGGLSLN